MIRGQYPSQFGSFRYIGTENDVHRVMSGVITGPYFLKFFNDPSALAVGTMVAVLEVGAFGDFPSSLT